MPTKGSKGSRIPRHTSISTTTKKLGDNSQSINMVDDLLKYLGQSNVSNRVVSIHTITQALGWEAGIKAIAASFPGYEKEIRWLIVQYVSRVEYMMDQESVAILQMVRDYAAGIGDTDTLKSASIKAAFFREKRDNKGNRKEELLAYLTHSATWHDSRISNFLPRIVAALQELFAIDQTESFSTSLAEENQIMESMFLKWLLAEGHRTTSLQVYSRHKNAHSGSGSIAIAIQQWEKSGRPDPAWNW